MWTWIGSIWTRFWTWLRAGGVFAVIGKLFFVIVVVCLAPRMITAFVGGVVTGWQYGWRSGQQPVQQALVQPTAPVIQSSPAVKRRVMKPGDGEWFELDPDQDSIEIELPPQWDYFLQPPDRGWVAIYVDGRLKDNLTYEEFERGKRLSNKSWLITLRGGPVGGRAYLRLADP